MQTTPKKRRLGCINRTDVALMHASLPTTSRQLLPAWSRIPESPRILGHNDTIGCCAIVAALNAVQTVKARLGDFTPLSDELGPQIYSIVTGYDPSQTDAEGNNPTDKGTEPEALFARWAKHPIGGYRLASFTRINPANLGAIRNAITEGGAYLCLELAVEQENVNEWTPVGTPGSWGGHAVWSDTYEANWFRATSWGEGITVDADYLTGGYAVAVYSLELVPA